VLIEACEVLQGAVPEIYAILSPTLRAIVRDAIKEVR
jgi:hypothetical protein